MLPPDEDEVVTKPKPQSLRQVSNGFMDGIDLRPKGIKPPINLRHEPPLLKGKDLVKRAKVSPIKYAPKEAKKINSNG